MSELPSRETCRYFVVLFTKCSLLKKTLLHSWYELWDSIFLHSPLQYIFSCIHNALQNMRSHAKCNAFCRHKHSSFCKELFICCWKAHKSSATIYDLSVSSYDIHITKNILGFVKNRTKNKPATSPGKRRLYYCSLISDVRQEIPDNTNY